MTVTNVHFPPPDNDSYLDAGISRIVAEMHDSLASRIDPQKYIDHARSTFTRFDRTAHELSTNVDEALASRIDPQKFIDHARNRQYKPVAPPPTTPAVKERIRSDKEFHISTREEMPGEWTVYVDGPMDYTTSPKMRAELTALLERPADIDRIWFDIAGVTCLDSTGIGFLIIAYRIADELGIPVVIINQTRFYERLLTLVGAQELLWDPIKQRM